MSQLPTRPPIFQRLHEHAGSIVGTCAVLTIGLLIVAGVLRIIGSAQGQANHSCNALAEALAFLAIGLSCCGLALGASALLRLSRELLTTIARVERLVREDPGLAPQAGPPPSPDNEKTHVGLTRPVESGESGPAPWEEMIALLQEIRDNSLLSEDQRRQRRLQQSEIEIARVRELVESLIAHGEFRRARQTAENLARRFPDEPRARELAQWAESSRVQRESDQITIVTKQINDLISISSWVRARQLAQRLQEQYPDSAEVRNLLIRIEREHHLAQQEQQRRMYAEVQRFVSRRRWEEALAGTRTFIERFGGTPDAEALRMQIPTLEQNAEIEYRQQVEAQIMELARHGRYIEAVDMARGLIEKYPDSPQADALRPQLPRLEELANDPDAPPARVRLE